MKPYKLSLAAALLAGTALVAPTASHANIVNGTGYAATNAQASNATQTAFVGLTPIVTFSAPSPLNFDSRTSGTGNTLGGFLATGGATGVTFENGGTSGQLLTNGSTTGTIFRFTGTVSVTTGETFTFVHDDGVTLDINGLAVINQPGPTAPVTQTGTYTGAPGNFAFNLVYGECCGPPAVLKVNLPLNAPEPGSLALLGTALAGLGLTLGLRRRKAA